MKTSRKNNCNKTSINQYAAANARLSITPIITGEARKGFEMLCFAKVNETNKKNK